ncbi:PIN domain-containing protein [Cohnella hongkongensis]|uniref:PIN domain-containing protein n=1 Tax=Cohnella hongkongensis TaxID=178337 RepID=A0ABV9FJX9_9BACL
MKTMLLADANIGLRILVGQHDIELAISDTARKHSELKFLETKRLLGELAAGRVGLVFTDAVIEEMFYVLNKSYGKSRTEISAGITALLAVEGIESTSAIREAVKLYGTMNLDIVDIKLSVLSKELGLPVLTWDKGFKHLSCEYYSPAELSIKTNDSDDDE